MTKKKLEHVERSFLKWSEVKHVMTCFVLATFVFTTRLSVFLLASLIFSSLITDTCTIISISHNILLPYFEDCPPSLISASLQIMEGKKGKDSSPDGMSNSFQSFVQVPADFFASLMAEVKDLKQLVASLQQNLDKVQRGNTAISSELQGVRETVAKMPEFYRFPLLPTEIRRMIASISLALPTKGSC